MRREHGLDLAGLDPEATDLELLVGAAEEFEGAVRPPAGEVSGEVEPLAPRAERIGDEALGGQIRPGEIAARQAVAADPELSRRSDRHRRQRRVQQPDAGVGDRTPIDGSEGQLRAGPGRA